MEVRSFIPAHVRARIADMRGRGPYQGYPNKYQCIYIHIPKTAGTSISETLFRLRVNHEDYHHYLDVNKNKFKNYYKFSFVRNPWDRLVSTYFFLTGGGMSAWDRMWTAQNLAGFVDFSDFVHNGLRSEVVESCVLFKPQAGFIADNADRIMVDFVGRYERLNSDFLHVAERLGIRMFETLKITNQSKRDHYASYYDDETREIVRQVYQRDITLFGYEFSESDV